MVIDQFESMSFLIDRATGEEIQTTYSKIDVEQVKDLKRAGWNFDWTLPYSDGFNVYQLNFYGDDQIQGLIAIELDDRNNAVKIDIVENAPHNIGSGGKYKGVGGLLFAIGAKISIENGFDGFVYFIAKSDLIEYYREEFGAILVNPRERIMAIEEDAAHMLVGRYFSK